MPLLIKIFCDSLNQLGTQEKAHNIKIEIPEFKASHQYIAQSKLLIGTQQPKLTFQ